MNMKEKTIEEGKKVGDRGKIKQIDEGTTFEKDMAHTVGFFPMNEKELVCINFEGESFVTTKQGKKNLHNLIREFNELNRLSQEPEISEKKFYDSDKKEKIDIAKVDGGLQIEVPINILDALDVQSFDHLRFVQRSKNEYIIEKIQ